MQLQQLRYLLAAAEHGSLRSAAQQLYVSQSSLSVAIKDLEQETGTTIFTRTSRGITLTNEGVELLGYARQIVEQADLMLSRYTQTDHKGTARFSVSSQHYSLVAQAFKEFLAARNDEACDFALRETYTNQIIRDVQDGRSELGILYLSNHNDRVISRALESSGLRFTSLYVAHPHVFVGKDHPLATRSSIRMEELSGMYRFAHEQGVESSSYYAEEPLSGIPHKRSVTFSDNGTLASLLAALDGFTIATGVYPIESGLVPVPLETDEFMNVGYIERKNAVPSAFAQEFLRLLSLQIRAVDGQIEASSTVYDLTRAD